jgi:hypothetical protein
VRVTDAIFKAKPGYSPPCSNCNSLVRYASTAQPDSFRGCNTSNLFDPSNFPFELATLRHRLKIRALLSQQFQIQLLGH